MSILKAKSPVNEAVHADAALQPQQLGWIVGGSLSEGLEFRIDNQVDPRLIFSGRFVCIRTATQNFFSIIDDLTLNNIDPEALSCMLSKTDRLFASIYRQQHLFFGAKIKPMLVVEAGRASCAVRTIPPHFSPVTLAQPEDIELVFGTDGAQNGRYFAVGSPLGMQTDVCIDLEAFVQRSNGIFGKTGTGKTFITRTILAGLINSGQAVNLIFDMHSEYGGQARSENKAIGFVKGLKNLLPHKVAVFSLDPESTSKRGINADVVVNFAINQIKVEDIGLMADELALHPTALEAAYLLSRNFQQDWLTVLLNSEDIKELAARIGAHVESLTALQRKLKRLEKFDFLKPSLHGPSIAQSIVDHLDRGISVVLEFGRHNCMLAYLLVTGIITRQIHHSWVHKSEKYLASKKAADEPRQLMITIEEAHKFLGPHAAQQTIFGLIAREMRKYYVSLLVVDQRPSGIDAEVLSQLGTKIVAQLNDEKDIAAVLTGVANASQIKSILSSLGPKKEALVMGYAVPMPVAIHTRNYDEQFFKYLQAKEKSQDKLIAELF